MLHLNHLKKSFGKNEILTDIEYTFEEGNIYPVLGGAGAGRTSLLQMILEIWLIRQQSIVQNSLRRSVS